MTLSTNNVPIRLPDERWAHIIEEHPEMEGLQEPVLEAVSDPDRVIEGRQGEMIAVREVEDGKWLATVYREMEDDGFIITAFLTRRTRWFERRKQLWP